MKDFLLRSNQFLGKTAVKYAQYIFFFIAALVLPIEDIAIRTVILFAALFLARLPLLYDILSAILMITCFVTFGLANGFANWFSAVFAIWLAIEVIKFLPFIVLRDEDIPLPYGKKIVGDKLVDDDAPPEDGARKFWD